MTKHPTDTINADEDLVNVLLNSGLKDAFRLVLQRFFNSHMREERTAYLNLQKPYERSSERNGYANGFKHRSLNTPVGKLDLDVPQTRDTSDPFYPSILERGSRCQRALKLAIAEMYVSGVSTRKVNAITEQLCGLEITASQVSRIAKEMDEELEKWRNRHSTKKTSYFFSLTQLMLNVVSPELSATSLS